MGFEVIFFRMDNMKTHSSKNGKKSKKVENALWNDTHKVRS